MEKITQSLIANEVGVTPSFICQILRDHRPCPPALAPRLEMITGIDRTVWVWGTKDAKLSAWKQFVRHYEVSA